jgi:hypothetical protein
MLDEKEPRPNFLIWRIDVIRFDVLCYTCTSVGLPLLQSCNDKMEPRDYAVYSGGYLLCTVSEEIDP